jgi:hypothetical protein
MLSPKRTKYRKQQRGRMKGKATRGNRISFGEYGLVALEPAWITARQIEATPSTGFASSSQAASSLKWGEFLKQQPGRPCAWPLTSFPSKLSL